MAEEKKPNAAAELFAKHGEKLGLAAVAAALVAYLVMGILMKKETPEASSLRSSERTILAELSQEHAEKAPPGRKDWQAMAVAPWNDVGDVKKKIEHLDWAASSIPKIKENPIALVVEKKKEPRVPGLTFGSASAAIDGVTVTWSVTETPKAEQTKLAKDFTFPPLSHFVLERQTGAAGKWEVLADKLPATQTSYVDSKIDPKTQYGYRITAYCADSQYLAMKDPSGKTATVGTSQPVATLGIWKLNFLTFMKDLARIEIEKFDKGLGQTVKVVRNTKPGEKIGWWEEPPDNKVTSKHYVMAGAMRKLVDFDTGMTLKAVEPDTKIEKEITKCKVIMAPGGGRIRCDKVKEIASAKFTKIVYTDEAGKEVTEHKPDPATDPRLQDQPCEECKKGLVVTEGGIVKEDPKTVADREAQQLLKDAEALAAENNKVGAKGKYEDLLYGKYKDSDFVKKNFAAIKKKYDELFAKPAPAPK